MSVKTTAVSPCSHLRDALPGLVVANEDWSFSYRYECHYARKVVFHPLVGDCRRTDWIKREVMAMAPSPIDALKEVVRHNLMHKNFREAMGL